MVLLPHLVGWLAWPRRNRPARNPGTDSSYESVGMTPEQITKYLDPVIERVTREMVERITPPEKIEPAAAKEPNSAWWGTNSTYAMKSVNKVKKGKEVVEMKYSDIVES